MSVQYADSLPRRSVCAIPSQGALFGNWVWRSIWDALPNSSKIRLHSLKQGKAAQRRTWLSQSILSVEKQIRSWIAGVGL